MYPTHRLLSFAACASVLLALACEAPSEPVEPVEPQFGPGGGPARATGGGHFDAGVDVVFSFSAIHSGANNDATGQMRFATVLGGLAIEFHGRVTCMAVDAVNNRAWIAGVVTQNRSEHPSFTTAIHQVGRDIWFRVVDYGEGANASQADRTTFVGFEGGGGIPTSEAYCIARIWPGPPTNPVDARTGPITEGNIQVRG